LSLGYLSHLSSVSHETLQIYSLTYSLSNSGRGLVGIHQEYLTIFDEDALPHYRKRERKRGFSAFLDNLGELKSHLRILTSVNMQQLELLDTYMSRESDEMHCMERERENWTGAAGPKTSFS
jgi:hypothetical protein